MAMTTWPQLQNPQTTGTIQGLGNVNYYPYYTTTTQTYPWTITYTTTPVQDVFEDGDIVRFKPDIWVGRAPGPFRIVGWHWQAFQAFNGNWVFFLETIEGADVIGLFPSQNQLVRDDFLTAVDKAKHGSKKQLDSGMQP